MNIKKYGSVGEVNSMEEFCKISKDEFDEVKNADDFLIKFNKFIIEFRKLQGEYIH